MIKNLLIPILIFCITLFSCKKEKTTWETDWSAPIAYGHLTINDMIPVEYTETNSEGYLSLVVHEAIFEFSLDTLINLPDTTILKKSAIGIPSIEVTPSFELPDNYDQAYELGEIQLKQVILQSGTALTSIKSPWKGKTKITFTLPNVTGPEGTFQRVYFLDAGSPEVQSEVADIVDMAFNDMDLTGIDGNLINTLGIDILIESNEETDNFIVTNTDSISFAFTFENMIPRYARGYFGQYTFSDTMAVKLAPMKKIVAGTINLDSIALNLSIKNGFNLVAQAEISKFTGYNTRTINSVDLNFDEKNTTINIDPATGGYYDYVPSEYPIELNNTNTNLTDFIENLSDSLSIGYELKINPFGNISAGNDEFFPDSKMELFLDAEFPLDFSIDNLTIQDTVKINWIDTEYIKPEDAVLFIEYNNGFPIGANAKFYILDETGTVIDSLIGSAPILSGSYLTDTFLTTPQAGIVEFTISREQMDKLEAANQLILNVSFTSDGSQNIKISPDTFFDFKIRSNLKISVSF